MSRRGSCPKCHKQWSINRLESNDFACPACGHQLAKGSIITVQSLNKTVLTPCTPERAAREVGLGRAAWRTTDSIILLHSRTTARPSECRLRQRYWIVCLVWGSSGDSRPHNSSSPNIFIYDEIPQTLRVQIIHIWADSIGEYESSMPDFRRQRSQSNELWDLIHKALCKEYGLFQLHERGHNTFDKCQLFIQECSVEQVLDIVELTFKAIDELIRDWDTRTKSIANISQTADDAIEELNSRYREHGLGYQYINGQVVRVDSQYIFDSAVKPALMLLQEEDFSGASEEFLKAHEHFLKGRNKEAVNDALKSFESVMKTICKRMNWTVSENATATPLLKVCFDNKLIPESLQSQFTSLRATLESGLPTLRNKTSGHGQGEVPKQLPPHFVAYALHLAATNIVFLVESYKSIQRNS